MLITDIRVTKRGRISVYIDGEFNGVLHPDIAAVSHLSIGEAVTSERLLELHGLSLEKMAKERAISLIAGRSYTAQGLYEKLEAYTDANSANAAVTRMEELGLIDDRDYAKRYSADCMHLKGYSLRRTAQALRNKGIDRQLIDEVLSEIEHVPEPAIAAIVLRKHPRFLENEKLSTKALNALVRLGYNYGDIRTVMRNLEEDIEYYDQSGED